MNFKRDVELVIDGQRFGFADVQAIPTASSHRGHVTALVARCADCGRPFAQSVRATSLGAANVMRRCAEHRKAGTRVTTIYWSATRKPPAFTAVMSRALAADAFQAAGTTAEDDDHSAPNDPRDVVLGKGLTAAALLSAIRGGWSGYASMVEDLGISKVTLIGYVRRCVASGWLELNDPYDSKKGYVLTEAGTSALQVPGDCRASAMVIGRSWIMKKDVCAKDLIELLQHGWVPKSAIGKALGMSGSSVVRMLRRAVQLGIIERATHQTYRLTDAWREQNTDRPASADGLQTDGMGPPARQML